MARTIALVAFLISAHAAFPAAMPDVRCDEANSNVTSVSSATADVQVSLKLCTESIGRYVPTELSVAFLKLGRRQTIAVARSPDGPDQIEESRLNQTLFLEDINFDGFPDIKVLRWYGATGNKGYLYFLYDPQLQSFEDQASDELLELSNPVPNAEGKEICTLGKLSLDEYMETCYEWFGPHVVLKSKAHWYSDRSTGKAMVKKSVYAGGKLVSESVGEAE